jgi:hypothetical protein
MLNDMAIWVFWPSIRILRITTDPFFGDHKLSMSHSSRSDLEASPLKLVLSIDFSKVLPLGCFTVASGSGLYISLVARVYSRLTGWCDTCSEMYLYRFGMAYSND